MREGTPTSRARILITGGSGYVAPFVAQRLAETYDVTITFNSRAVSMPGMSALHLDLLHPAEADRQAITDLNPIVVIHAAAMANTAECEQRPEIAEAVNVRGTENLLDLIPNKDALIIYISTDLVYAGDKPPYSEESECNPICVYGCTKLAAEKVLQSRWKHQVSLRSALEYGPPCRTSGRTCFLQFFDTALANGTPLSCFDDEFRSVLFVGDMAEYIYAMAQRFIATAEPPPHNLYVVGGPHRLSRFEIAERVAAVRGYSTPNLVPVHTRSVTSQPRPPDTTLDCSRLRADYPHILSTPLERALFMHPLP